jgi:hypothetical protein
MRSNSSEWKRELKKRVQPMYAAAAVAIHFVQFVRSRSFGEFAREPIAEEIVKVFPHLASLRQPAA